MGYCRKQDVWHQSINETVHNGETAFQQHEDDEALVEYCRDDDNLNSLQDEVEE